MIPENHDTLSVCIWLNRLLKCGVRAPKMVISYQSLALMLALVQSFTQYDSLEDYLLVCFHLVMNTSSNNIPSCYVRNDINHFVKLISQRSPLNKSKFPRTKKIICEINDTFNILKKLKTF
jgi:hypothetical protein